MTPLLLRLAVRLLPSDARAEVLRELLEQHHNIRQTRGRWAAVWWTCRQPLTTLALTDPGTTGATWSGWVDDVRVGGRGLLRRPGLAATVIATIGISVAAIAAMASVLDGVMLKPLPFPDEGRLVWISAYDRGPNSAPFNRAEAASAWANPMDVVDWAGRARHLAAVAPFETFSATVRAGDRPLRISGATVRATMGDVLQVPPALGRHFNADDYGAGVRVVMLSHELWRTAFGADVNMVGRKVLIDEEPFDVVGILPDMGFRFPQPDTDLWLPLPPPATSFQNRGGSWQRVVARVKADVTVATADADMQRVARELAEEYPDTNKNRHVTLVPLREGLVGATASVLWLLTGAVVLVLLVACANVGHLLLVSAQSRQRELAVRAALGARTWRLARLLFAETAWLAVIGGALGIALSSTFLRLFVELYPEDLPSVGDLTVSGLPLLAALTAITISACLAAVPSLMQSRGLRVQEAMRSTERGSENRRQRRVRAGLVVAQVAVSTMLLIGGGLLVRTFLTMRTTETGFTSDSVLTFNLSLGERRYPALADEVRFQEALLSAIKALPGVEVAGTTTLLPLTRGEFGDGFYRVGFDDVYPNIPIARLQNVSAGYFEAIGLPVVAGRPLTATDTAEAPRVVVVNQALERRYFPDGALGQRIRFRNEIAEVVGVVADKRHRNLRDTPRPEMFYPRSQIAHPRLFSWVAVRTSGDPMVVLPDIRHIVTGLDDGVAVDAPASMSERVDQAVAPDRFRASLVGALAVVALLLAALGLYGLIASTVAREARDIAIRMALGAAAGSVVITVLRSVLLLTAAGVIVGVAGAMASRDWLASFLSGVAAGDPLTISVTAGALLLTAAAAAAGPAIRASRIDPCQVLRSQ